MRPFEDPNERLYRRLNPSRDIRNGVVLSSGFAFEKPEDGKPASGMSFDRGLMRQPAEVIAAHPGFVVGAILVNDIPPAVLAADQSRFSFRPLHRPIPTNPSHSEIRSYNQEGTFVAYPPNLVRKLFREELVKHVAVIQP